MDLKELREFSMPFYAEKDLMHNLWHIELVYKWVQKIIRLGNYDVDKDCLLAASYFHGFIANHEDEIRNWLLVQGFNCEKTDKIVTTARESLASSIPRTIEGKILHDAHLIEGGKVYIIAKCLITGSLRGQTLLETIDYMENNIIDKRECFLPETISLFEEANQFAKEFLAELKNGIL